MKKFSIGKKLSEAVVLATAFMIGANPMTAFAQANPDAEEIKVEASVSDNDVVAEVSEDDELAYHYTVKEDGSVVFNFNGEEYEVNAQNITFIKNEVKLDGEYRVEFEMDEDTGAIYRAVMNEKVGE